MRVAVLLSLGRVSGSMTDSNADAATRRARIAEAITAHRQAGSEEPVLFATGAERDDDRGDGGGNDSTATRPFVDYQDREITVELTDAERDRLDDLLGEFTVFKIAQPATRKAGDGVVHVSAIADPKHAADFVDRLFLDVFEAGAGYGLVVED
jgi:hypothetical protein